MTGVGEKQQFPVGKDLAPLTPPTPRQLLQVYPAPETSVRAQRCWQKWYGKFRISFLALPSSSLTSLFVFCQAAKHKTTTRGALSDEHDARTLRVTAAAERMTMSCQLRLYAGVKIPCEDDSFAIFTYLQE